MQMRVAYFSPLNPVPSGISDYSEDLLPYLASYADIDLFVDEGYRPVNSDIVAHFRIYPYGRYPRLLRRQKYDITLYHVGNSPAHDYILTMLERYPGVVVLHDYVLTMLERYPGVVVLHDYVLHHLMLWRAFRHGDGRAYHDAMLRYGEAGRRLAQRMMRGQLAEEAFQYPLCEEVVAAATAVIVHSNYVAGRVREMHPDVPLAVVPMGVPIPCLPERGEARRHLGLPEEALVLASFGHLNPYKRLEPALRAYRRLRQVHPESLFLLVGSLSPHFDLAGLLRRLDLGEAVRVTGFVEMGTFLGYLSASDICLNLRFPSAGETSASLLRILGAGLPTLVSRTAAFAELPPEVAIQVDVGEEEEEEIFAFLSYLADQPDFCRVLRQNARRYVSTHHTLEGAAAGYARFLGRLCGREAVEVRPPLFLPQTGRPAPLPETPPMAPSLEETLPLAVQLAAQALSEIGLEEDDRASIRAVAGILSELPDLF